MENHKSGYRPIRDYAMIGDCHGAALISRAGDVDWCCLRRFDEDPVFCRLLDAQRGGFLSVRPLDEFAASREYLEGTNILRTRFSTREGVVTITDFLPVGRRPGSGTHDYVSLNAPGWLVRIVEGEQGRVPVQVRYRASVAFARHPAELVLAAGELAIEGGPSLYHDKLSFSVAGDTAVANVTVASGDRMVIVLSSTRAQSSPIGHVDRLFEVTRAFWREWIDYCRYEGPYKGAVQRSALLLKLLTYAPTGAFVAAPTTSLPEEVGGTRNWDYRYCWLRDTAFTLYALAALGYGGEARSFSAFLRNACATTQPNVQIMYGIGGEVELRELTLNHLDGYMGSRPVRTGNEAYLQRQTDIYGEILDWADIFHTLGGRLDAGARTMLTSVADHVAANWRDADQGLWEMRSAARHHVHSKMMSWVALDRAVRLLGAQPHWVEQRRLILEDIRTRGMAAGHLLQAYDWPGTDAALLLAPVLAFPVGRDELAATVAAVERELRHGDFVYRYKGPDGAEGSEGAFLICSFWLVDALLQLGRPADAKSLFEKLLAHANDVGLYAEQIDAKTGAFLGNFPQAFTHLALIGAAVNLDLYERRGPTAIEGSHADRARCGVGATLGWRGLLAAFRATRRVGRIFSSRHSVLATAGL